MDIFGVREHLVEDYQAFTSGSVVIRDERIQQAVRDGLSAQWPDPWLSLNPSFAPGGTVTDLVRDGVLHPECERIFRFGKSATDPGRPLAFHRHQRDAIEAAVRGGSYVLTTGTGSGKSLAYIVPIVDRVLRERAATPNPKISAHEAATHSLADTQRHVRSDGDRARQQGAVPVLGLDEAGIWGSLEYLQAHSR